MTSGSAAFKGKLRAFNQVCRLCFGYFYTWFGVLLNINNSTSNLVFPEHK